jgi:hypothetical protein
LGVIIGFFDGIISFFFRIKTKDWMGNHGMFSNHNWDILGNLLGEYLVSVTIQCPKKGPLPLPWIFLLIFWSFRVSLFQIFGPTFLICDRTTKFFWIWKKDEVEWVYISMFECLKKPSNQNGTMTINNPKNMEYWIYSSFGVPIWRSFLWCLWCLLCLLTSKKWNHIRRLTYGVTTHLMKDFICWVDECWPFIEALGLDGAQLPVLSEALHIGLLLKTPSFGWSSHRYGQILSDLGFDKPFFRGSSGAWRLSPWNMQWQSSLGGWNSLVLWMLYCNHHDSWYMVCCEKQTIFTSNMGHFCLTFVKSYPN